MFDVLRTTGTPAGTYVSRKRCPHCNDNLRYLSTGNCIKFNAHRRAGLIAGDTPTRRKQRRKGITGKFEGARCAVCRGTTRYKATGSCVYAAYHRRGALGPTTYKPHNPNDAFVLTAEDMTLVKTLVDGGMNDKEVAKKFDVGVRSLRRRLAMETRDHDD